MHLTWTLSEDAETVIETLRLPGESDAACADRLLGNLLAISLDQDNYAQHFGEQTAQHATEKHDG
jgi:hypothetical protein